MPAPQSVLNFFIAVLQDENLKSQFTKALGKEDTPAMVNLAKEHGYDFTANELRQELKYNTYVPAMPHIPVTVRDAMI
ncbi:Nif11-like leader peptide family natural product precursor [Pleurocapsa sp. FMAR1]|uniref:Nif11-like leader peptide family natural product precursor n=1 Tax=Pleurocapsa sp. FMAR1 TaxID=3040204 RepID=UPI0029C8DFA6|nr:Nif11-like leader peptide family natural product precursor [Pleurocapsa sp. FMAR1]